MADGLTQKEASARVGVCVTVIKRICRACGVGRWPGRRVRALKARVVAKEGNTPAQEANQTPAVQAAQGKPQANGNSHDAAKGAAAPVLAPAPIAAPVAAPVAVAGAPSLGATTAAASAAAAAAVAAVAAAAANGGAHHAAAGNGVNGAGIAMLAQATAQPIGGAVGLTTTQGKREAAAARWQAEATHTQLAMDVAVKNGVWDGAGGLASRAREAAAPISGVGAQAPMAVPPPISVSAPVAVLPAAPVGPASTLAPHVLDEVSGAPVPPTSLVSPVTAFTTVHQQHAAGILAMPQQPIAQQAVAQQHFQAYQQQ